jgi:hypothetical protein
MSEQAMRATMLRAMAELPEDDWEYVRNLSRWGSLAALHDDMRAAEERGWVERRNRNEHGMRAIWQVRLTAAGREALCERERATDATMP